MYVEEILVNDFRMLTNRKFKFSKEFNLIYGKNAQGKTSLIESVYFLASGKSFRTRKLTEQIKEKEKRLTVFGICEKDKYSIELTNDKRNFYKNQEKIQYKDYLGNILVVSFSPEDIELITGSPDMRRRFFNYEISQVDKNYLRVLLDYQKVLKVRNKLIKEDKTQGEIFNIYTEKYIELGVKLLLLRNKYINNLSLEIEKKYKKLFGTNKEIELIYDGFLNIKIKPMKN